MFATYTDDSGTGFATLIKNTDLVDQGVNVTLPYRLVSNFIFKRIFKLNL
jgi:hypothetical protein